MDSNEALYRDNILDHYKNPQNFGELDPHDVEFFDYNPLCGDEMGVQIKVGDRLISDLRFSGSGCAISLASASIISDSLIGMSLVEVKELDAGWLEEQIGLHLSPVRLKCGLLGLKVVQGALFGKQEWPTRQNGA